MENVIERNGHRYVLKLRVTQMLDIGLNQLKGRPAFQEWGGEKGRQRQMAHRTQVVQRGGPLQAASYIEEIKRRSGSMGIRGRKERI